MGTSILITVSGALLGVVFSESYRFLRERKKSKSISSLSGSWISAYPAYHSTDTQERWIRERVNISIRGSQLVLSSKQNPVNDNYDASGTVNNGEWVGDWQSTERDAAYASGNFIFRLSPTGRYMYGVFSGPRTSNERVFVPWILGRDEASVIEASRRVDNQFVWDFHRRQVT